MRETFKVLFVRSGLGLLGLLCITSVLTTCKKPAPVAAPPPEVYVTQVTQRDVPVYMELVGQTRGFQDVDIRARVEGYLDSMNFREGSFVKKGDLLYQIDPKPFEAQVAASKANLVTAQARLTKMQTDVDRLTPLAKIQAVSQKELDDAVANRDAAKAQVDAEKAKLDQAQLDLGYTQVTAPLDGLIGTTNVKVGNLVGRGENTLLDTISVIDPILFRCGLSEAEYLDLARRAEELKKQLAGKPVEVQLILADGTIHPNTGR